jgi:hypothetical protein
MKTVDDRRKAVSQAISRAYGVSIWPVEISTEHAERDARDFVRKTAGHPHADLTVAAVAALTPRARRRCPPTKRCVRPVRSDRRRREPRSPGRGSPRLNDPMALHRKKRAHESSRRISAKARIGPHRRTALRRAGRQRVEAPKTAGHRARMSRPVSPR